ncbi:hypothetical protein ABFX02_10G021900 [Erythranthe guttata]
MGEKRLRHDSDFQLKKCAKKRYQHSDVDRISQLPDDILVTIVSSFLSLKEAARTSVLSSRWINLWKHIPCLNFDAEQKRLWDEESAKKLLDEERRKYVEWVNSVLKSHKAATLKEYRISFDLCRSTGEPVNRWLEFAFSRRVQILELDLSPTIMNWRPWSKTYAFPEELLTRTSGGASILEPASCIDFKSLKALSMRFVNVSGEAIEFFLRTCPFLEKLVVHNASELSNLEVCGSSLALKHLELQSCHNLTSIKVSAPNLTSLTLPNVKGLLLENVPMLVEVSVSCVCTVDPVEKLLVALSGRIFQLESLSLVLPFYPEAGDLLSMFPQLPKLKKLVINYTVKDKESFIGLTPLMWACPNLQEFVFESICDEPSRLLRRKVKKNPLKVAHEHLKVFKFLGYCGSSSDLEFVRYILENCIALEKLIIDTHFQVKMGRAIHCQELLDIDQSTRTNVDLQLPLVVVPKHIDFVLL